MKQDKASPRILIIEDEAQVAESLQRLLEDRYVVEITGTAEEGIARVQANDFETPLAMIVRSSIPRTEAIE